MNSGRGKVVREAVYVRVYEYVCTTTLCTMWQVLAC